MKGESGSLPRRRDIMSKDLAEGIALEAFQRLAADAERLGRFLAVSGLDAGSVRQAASEAGFLPAVLDYLCADEALLVAIAAELGRRPEQVAEARHKISPEPDWDA